MRAWESARRCVYIHTHVHTYIRMIHTHIITVPLRLAPRGYVPRQPLQLSPQGSHGRGIKNKKKPVKEFVRWPFAFLKQKCFSRLSPACRCLWQGRDRQGARRKQCACVHVAHRGEPAASAWEKSEQLPLGTRVSTLWRRLAASKGNGCERALVFSGDDGSAQYWLVGREPRIRQAAIHKYSRSAARTQPAVAVAGGRTLPHLMGGGVERSETCFLSHACFVLLVCSSCLLMSTRLAATLATLAPADGPSVRERGIGRKGDRKGGRERFHC
jgi:hypothetical protein